MTAIAAIESRLLPSLAICASPGFSPTKKTLPNVRGSASTTPKVGRGRTTIAANVPFRAPLTPPETGASLRSMRSLRDPVRCVPPPRADRRELDQALRPGAARDTVLAERHFTDDLWHRQTDQRRFDRSTAAAVRADPIYAAVNQRPHSAARHVEDRQR